MSTSSGQPRGCSCTPWPPASARSSICTASGPSHWTRAADRSSTTTTTLWSTSTPPAPVLTPCRWSSGLWAHYTDRGRSSSTPDPVTVGGTCRNHLRRQTEIFKATAAVENSLPTIPSYFHSLEWPFSTSGKLRLDLSAVNDISTATSEIMSLVLSGWC